MKVSLQLIPEQPAEELVAAVKVADELGFYACYSADEIYHKDAWLLLGSDREHPYRSVCRPRLLAMISGAIEIGRHPRRRPGHPPRPHRAARSPGAARLRLGAVRDPRRDRPAPARTRVGRRKRFPHTAGSAPSGA